MINTTTEALQYLRNCKKIIIPSKYTYFCHSGQVQTDENYSENAKFNKLWTEIPADNFVIKGEMSFLAQRDRLKYVAESNSFDAAPVSYAGVAGQEDFQIKVLLPKQNLTKEEFYSLGKDDDQITKLQYSYRGLGDGRHPKLAGGTKIHIIGYMQNDEMSGKQIKTVIGVREEDLVFYANQVKLEIAQNAKKGQLVDSHYEMPDNNAGVIVPKETFVMGENLYKKEIAKIEESDIDQNTDKKESTQKTYQLDLLEKQISAEFAIWKDSEDPVSNRYKSVKEARENRREYRSKVANLGAVTVKNGKTEAIKHNDSNSQLLLLNLVENECKKLAKSIQENLDSKYGNYLHYAMNDFCDLELLDSVLPEIRERYNALKDYEKQLNSFTTSAIEQKTAKRRGLLGFFGVKQTYQERRKLTPEELQSKKQEDILKLNISLAEGEISQIEYDKTITAIRYLYDNEIPDKKSEKKAIKQGAKTKETTSRNTTNQQVLDNQSPSLTVAYVDEQEDDGPTLL